MATALSSEFSDYQTNGLNVQFDLGGGSSIGLDPTKIGLTLMGNKAGLNEATRLAARCIKEWNSHVKTELSFSRVGVRLQAVSPSEMTAEELLDVCSGFVFSEPFRTLAPAHSDFSVTVEDIDGTDGTRRIMGVMSFEEILQKWQLPEDSLEVADSFLTVDTDIGASGVRPHDIELHIRRAWATITEQNALLVGMIGL